MRTQDWKFESRTCKKNGHGVTEAYLKLLLLFIPMLTGEGMKLNVFGDGMQWVMDDVERRIRVRWNVWCAVSRCGFEILLYGLLFKINMKGDVNKSYDLLFRRNRDICCLFSAAGSHEIDSFEIRSNYYSTWCSTRSTSWLMLFTILTPLVVVIYHWQRTNELINPP